jgi:hypothetical protein
MDMENKEFSTDGLRTFFNANTEDNYYIVSPTAEDIRGADWEYSKSYTKSLVAGITTTAEMTDILMRRGIIGPEFEQRSNELANELGAKVAALGTATNSEEKAELAVQVAVAREELFQWNQRLNAPLGNTCEQMADDARLEFLTSKLIVTDKGEKVWEDFDSYLTEKVQSLAQQSRFEIMLYLQGLDSDFLDNTPEAVAMKELEAEASLEVIKEIADMAEEVKAEKKAPAKPRPVRKTRARKTTKKTD